MQSVRRARSAHSRAPAPHLTDSGRGHPPPRCFIAGHSRNIRRWRCSTPRMCRYADDQDHARTGSANDPSSPSLHHPHPRPPLTLCLADSEGATATTTHAPSTPKPSATPNGVRLSTLNPTPDRLRQRKYVPKSQAMVSGLRPRPALRRRRLQASASTRAASSRASSTCSASALADAIRSRSRQPDEMVPSAASASAPTISRTVTSALLASGWLTRPPTR